MIQYFPKPNEPFRGDINEKNIIILGQEPTLTLILLKIIKNFV